MNKSFASVGIHRYICYVYRSEVIDRKTLTVQVIFSSSDFLDIPLRFPGNVSGAGSENRDINKHSVSPSNVHTFSSQLILWHLTRLCSVSISEQTT